MTKNRAMKILKEDADWCGMPFNTYLGYVGMHRGAFPQGVLEAFDVWAENRRQEKKEK